MRGTITVDLHNHSCLSPCASLEMSPRAMAARARARGIRVLGLTDHNSALNCPAFAAACAECGIAPLFGMELNSVEEAHILILFASPDEALDFSRTLYDILPALPYDPALLGDQVAVDEQENIIDMPEKWLGAALPVGFDELAREGARRGALVIPAHVDRQSYSVGSQLGFLPEGPYDAVESVWDPPRSLCRDYPVISDSDAHTPDQIGRRPFSVEMEESVVESAIAAAVAEASVGDGAWQALSRLLSALRDAIARGPITTRIMRDAR